MSGRLGRLLLYAHDTFGLGHLRRNLAIATYLLRVEPDLQVVLASGSPVADRFALPRGMSIVTLPAVVKVGPEEYRSREPGLSPEAVRRMRAEIVAETARTFAPDVFLVDHAPQGMRGEVLPAYETLRRHSPRTRVVVGLRDVIDAPEAVRETWAAQGVPQTLDALIDRVLVYGSEGIHDVVAAYGLSPSVAAKTTYCGYIGRRGGTVDGAEHPHPGGTAFPLSEGTPFILGTAGGGGDGAPLLEATMEAAAALGRASLIVTGPLMDAAEAQHLQERAADLPGAHLVEFVPRLERVMARADAVVTMGGYNSLCEAAAAQVPTIVIPRVWPRCEQAIRAQLFEERGLVDVVLPGPALSERLTTAVRSAMSAHPRTRLSLDLGGLERLHRALLDEVMVTGTRAGTRQSLADQKNADQKNADQKREVLHA